MSQASEYSRWSVAGRRLYAVFGEFRARRAAHMLGSLSDRTLADIGISRSEIDSAVRGRGARAPRYFR